MFTYHVDFKEKPEKKLTRADWQAVGPPYIPSRYAEVDMVMSNRKTQHIIKDVESNTNMTFPSEQFPVNIRIKINQVKTRW